MDLNDLRTRVTSFIAAVITVIFLAIIDYLTDYEINFFVVYFLPVAVTAEVLGARSAYMISALSAAAWLIVDRYSNHPYSSVIYAYWNSLLLLFCFLVVAYAVSRIRILLDRERHISRELRETMSHCKTLGGLVPICATCKKIRNDKGYWQQIEEYIEKHSEAQFTHGICQECAAKAMRDSGLVPAEEETTGKAAP